MIFGNPFKAAFARRYPGPGCTFVATGVDILIHANAVRRLASDFTSSGAAQPVAPSAAC